MVAMGNMNFLSPEGLCYSFDHRANGYGRGEGIISLVVKPLSAALENGDTIRALIRSTGSNQDGRTPGITMPNSESQEQLIRHVYRKASLDPELTRYVEAHGNRTSNVEMRERMRSLMEFQEPGLQLVIPWR
jgi:acyl transferase domain-containing protein